MRLSTALLCGVGLVIAGCNPEKEIPTTLVDGDYQVIGARGFATQDESKVLAIHAHLDRANGQLTFTLADGSQRAFAIKFRTQSDWVTGCDTGSTHALEETADLSPAPLTLESITVTHPIMHAGCTGDQMAVSDTSTDLEGPYVLLQHRQ